jgi:hypothetical protein
MTTSISKVPRQNQPLRVNGFSGPLTPESTVLEACRAAAKAEDDYVQKAVLAGVLLLERRFAMEAGSTENWDSHSKPDADKFTAWLSKVGLKIPTAYRWMAAAENAARSALRIDSAMPFTPAIDIGGQMVPISTALLPDAKPSTINPQLSTFRQGFFDFMADKSISEAARAVVDGESPAHRITRAARGKLDGGSRGEDRKAWHTFIGVKLSDISGHLNHWKSFSASQKESTEEAFTRALEKWPTPLLEHLAKQIKAQLQTR